MPVEFVYNLTPTPSKLCAEYHQILSYGGEFYYIQRPNWEHRTPHFDDNCFLQFTSLHTADYLLCILRFRQLKKLHKADFQ